MKKLSYLIFLSFLLTLCAPAVQQKFNSFAIAPLNGSFINAEKPQLNKTSWFSGTFQNQTDKWLNENVGFRNLFIRLYNEIEFRLFSNTNAKDILVGKENYLFEQRYIDSYFGVDIEDVESLNKKVLRTKFIKDTLETMGVKMLFVIAPSKADYFQEKLPETNLLKPDITNYDRIIELFNEHDIDYIDFNNFFIQKKHSEQFPLFTKCGIHWSDYGATLVADSIIKKAEYLLHVNLPNLIVTNINKKNLPSYVDYDLGHLLNIFTTIDQGELGYPDIKFESDTNLTKPNALIIGDSFYWNLENTGVFHNSFNCNNFLYYLNTAYNNDQKNSITRLNLKQEIENKNIIIFIVTAAGVQDFDFGFADKVYPFYDKAYQKKIEQMITKISNDKNWLKSIEEKASQQGISTAEMLRLDAEYMVKQSTKQTSNN